MPNTATRRFSVSFSQLGRPVLYRSCDLLFLTGAVNLYQLVPVVTVSYFSFIVTVFALISLSVSLLLKCLLKYVIISHLLCVEFTRAFW